MMNDFDNDWDVWGHRTPYVFYFPFTQACIKYTSLGHLSYHRCCKCQSTTTTSTTTRYVGPSTTTSTSTSSTTTTTTTLPVVVNYLGVLYSCPSCTADVVYEITAFANDNIQIGKFYKSDQFDAIFLISSASNPSGKN